MNSLTHNNKKKTAKFAIIGFYTLDGAPVETNSNNSPHAPVLYLYLKKEKFIDDIDYSDLPISFAIQYSEAMTAFFCSATLRPAYV